MGHGQTKQKSPYETAAADQLHKNSGEQFPNEVREFPRVHGASSVTSVECINGTSVCLSGGSNGRIGLFDVNAKQLLKRWVAHEKEVTKVLHAGVEQMILSASRDKLVKLWENNSEQPLQVFSGHTLGVSAITSNKDGSSIVSGSRDNSVRLWDMKTGACVRHVTQARNMVTDMKWVPGTTQFVQTSEDKIMKIWDTRTLQVARSFPIKQYFQTCCDVSASGSYIVTGSTGFNGSGCEITLWDARETKAVSEYKGHHQKVSDCRYVTNSCDDAPGSLFISVSLDCSVKVWSPDVQACLASEQIPGAKELKTVASFQDGRFVIGTHDYGIHYFKLVEERDGLKINPLLRF